MTDPVVVVGAGWSGAVVAHQLAEQGVPVEVSEASDRVGGHARVETLNGVVYEPNGAHIFHTSNERVARLVRSLGIVRRYQHQVLTEIDLPDGPRLMSWPIQVSELEGLPDWSHIKRELADLPVTPSGDNLEAWCVSLMGRRLYELFIEGYTRKQWGRDPAGLSSSFGPKRIEIRTSGDRRLFRDRWQFFPEAGVNTAIEVLLRGVPVTCGADLRIGDLEGVRASVFVITAPLDVLLDRPGLLEWRGIRMRSRYVPTGDPAGKATAAYVINRPSPTVPYTRTVETKWATGQRAAGTVVSEEYPGAPARHYPVPTVDGRNEETNRRLMLETACRLAPTPVVFCGRLATYRYIDQDQAIYQAMLCADTLLAQNPWTATV